MNLDDSSYVFTAFTLTEEEWIALGGTYPPEGYDPEVWKTVTPHYKTQGGLAAHKTGLVPAVGDVFRVWQDVAERVGCKVLTIRWPDPHYPDFWAVEA